MTQTSSETAAVSDLLQELSEGQLPLDNAAKEPVRAPRNIPQMLTKIPVTLTLEVGSAQLSLAELLALEPDSVIELDTLAGQPLLMKVNGTVIGRAEVVVTGDTHGLRVVETDGLSLENLQK